MRRRDIISLLGGGVGALAWRSVASAQHTPRIGYLSGNAAASPSNAFLEGLRELGYVDGQNITVDFRFAQGRLELITELARDLIASRPDIIVASTNVIAVPARQTASG